MSRLHRALGLGTLLATAAAGIGASPSSASVVPISTAVTTPVTRTCQAPLAEPATPTAFGVYFVSWRNFRGGGSFREGAMLDTTIPGLQAALDRAGAVDATVDGTWRWHVKPSSPVGDAGFVDDVPLSSSRLRTAGGPVASSWRAIVPPPAGTAAEGADYTFSADALTYVVRGTDLAGQPADFGFVDDGDGDPTALTIPCTGARTEVGTLSVYMPPAGPYIGPISATDTTATVSISGGPYLEIYLDGRAARFEQVPGTPGGDPSYRLSGLTPNTTYQLSARTMDIMYGASRVSGPVEFTTLPAVQRPVAVGGPALLTLRNPRLTGSATGATSVTGELNPTTGAFSGSVALSPATASLKAYGWIPVKARLVFTAAGAATGTVEGDALTLNTTQDIAIKNTTFLGLKIDSGTCHTEVAPAITLRGPAASLAGGGTMTAAFVLGRIVGCGTYGSLTGTNGGSASLRTTLAPTPIPAS